jgi:hypothetical protein
MDQRPWKEISGGKYVTKGEDKHRAVDEDGGIKTD